MMRCDACEAEVEELYCLREEYLVTDQKQLCATCAKELDDEIKNDVKEVQKRISASVVSFLEKKKRS